MSLSEPFIRRPVGTTLLTIAVTIAGALSYFLLPVSPLPEVEFPTISVGASLPGASPETMASAVATPLERQFGRIAGVTEMTSSSTQGATSITLQFELDRDVDAAARDVQAAINAARGQLPANLPNNPSYRKVNPADSPILILALTSSTYTNDRMYDVASTILQQKLSQVPGVGQVYVGGGAQPAVRVELNPTVLHHLGLGLGDVRAALAAANANRPKGQLADDKRSWSVTATDQLWTADEYRPLLVAYRNGAAVRLGDVADVTDSVEDIRSFGLVDGEQAVMLIVFKQPGANIIETVDRVHELIPQLNAQIPAGMRLSVTSDRTGVIRASLHDVQLTLLVSVLLVVLVVYLFLRDGRATFIPGIAVPVSLIGTFGGMHLLGYSLNNLTLMALTISTGFVVDDAIVVVENVGRYLEEGLSPFAAAIRGAREIGFTVLSMSASLVAVFIPILLMRGLIGLLFREFAVTLSVAIAVSLVVSLTTTPMLCAVLLKPRRVTPGGGRHDYGPVFGAVLAGYARTLNFVLRHRWATLLVTISTVALTVYLYAAVPKGFFPQQDTGRLTGNIVADQDTSFQSMVGYVRRFAALVSEDPAVSGVVAFTGGDRGGGPNTGRMFVSLKPSGERKDSADQVIARLRGKASRVAGAVLLLQSVQDLRIGGRSSSAQYQYTIQGSTLQELNEWGPKLVGAMRKVPGIVDVNTDQQNRGLQTRLEIDRPTAARLGLSVREIDDTLYDAFGQRQVSTMYRPLSQYRVVMALEPQYLEGPEALRDVYVRTPAGGQVPIRDLYRSDIRNTSLAVPHSGLFPSATITFNLVPGTALSDVVPRIEDAVRGLGMPESIHGRFQGTAQAFQESLGNQPVLILAALVAVYVVLGMLYESFLHPLTILSTLPSAGVGALLALILCGVELNVMAMIGILLLIGVVKKNAILMIDFALDAQRTLDLPPQEAIRQACLLRLRPILMTTAAALLGGLPLALGTGVGSELRKPLGIAVVGGLIFSQMLTLYTTPVVYLFLDRLRQFAVRLAHRRPATRTTATPAEPAAALAR